MPSVNEARIIGNLGNAPDVRHTQAGTAVCTLSIATNRKWKDDAGKEHEEVSWHRVVVWGKQAENAGKYLAKGDPVYVAGRMQTRSYTDDKGIERWVTEVVAQSVQFLKPAPRSGPPHPAGAGRDTGGPPPAEWSDSGGPPPAGDDDIPF